jgi:hypothetical protein
MWRLKNETRYTAERGWIRDSAGKEIWIVAIKSTYNILPSGKLALSPEQPPVCCGPVKDFKTGELLYETDLGPEKRYTDIILNGHAWVPETTRHSPVLAGFKAGTLLRLAKIWPRRPLAYAENIDGFIKIPLIYQNMATGSAHKGEFYNPQGTKKPAIEFQHDDDSEIGFGPLPAHWRGRAALAGTYDAHWQATRYPLPPQDFNPLFWQIAAKPQQTTLKGGERIGLANLLSPHQSTNPVMSFSLPRQALMLTTTFSDGTTTEQRPKLHTLILEPDYPRVSLVWHSALHCHDRVNQLKSTRIWEKKRINQRDRQPSDGAFPELEQA